jgi:hypothetical protein
MEKIEIKPADKKQKALLEALKIRNRYMEIGITQRQSFINIIKYRCPDIDEKKLLNFWLMRLKDADFNNELEGVLESLIAE